MYWWFLAPFIFPGIVNLLGGIFKLPFLGEERWNSLEARLGEVEFPSGEVWRGGITLEMRLGEVELPLRRGCEAGRGRDGRQFSPEARLEARRGCETGRGEDGRQFFS